MDGKVGTMVRTLSQTPTSELQMRAADADRDRTVERLRDAAAEGRLTPDDLERRLETALAAPTYAELDRVVADLPQPDGARPAARARSELGGFLATSVLLVAIWAVTGMGYLWPVWPILGWGVFVVPGVLYGGRVRACRRSA
jgi:uncharacterized protein DUF1707